MCEREMLLWAGVRIEVQFHLPVRHYEEDVGLQEQAYLRAAAEVTAVSG